MNNTLSNHYLIVNKLSMKDSVIKKSDRFEQGNIARLMIKGKKR
jgi:hypothetical protein